MNKTFIIGIAGKKNSGKSTIAQVIARDMDAEELAFADPLKEMAAIVGYNDLYTSPYKKENLVNPVTNLTLRSFLQQLGTDMMRKANPDVFIQLLQLRLPYLSIAVVSDVRFKNEADWIKKNGLLIKVVRDELMDFDSHESESYIDELEEDYLISNNGAKKDLNFAAKEVVEWIKAEM